MKTFLLACLGAIIIPAMVLLALPAPFPKTGYLIGLAASALNAAIAYTSNRVAIGKELHTFFLRSALGHGARLALLTGFLVGTLRGDTPERSAILITLCIGYFTFLLSEIALLHSRLYHARSISRKMES